MKTLGVFAHPDDEAFGPGGTIARWSQEDDLFLVCVTNGNDPGTEDNLTGIRAKELRESARVLGVRDVFFLDYEDETLCNDKYHAVAETILEIAGRVGARRLLTYEDRGVSGHLDHIAVAMICHYLFDRNDRFKELWQYAIGADGYEKRKDYFVYFPKGYSREQVTEVINVTQVWGAKLKAIRAHVSQADDGNAIIGRIQELPKEEWFFVTRR